MLLQLPSLAFLGLPKIQKQYDDNDRELDLLVHPHQYDHDEVNQKDRLNIAKCLGDQVEMLLGKQLPSYSNCLVTDLEETSICFMLFQEP